ncbi:hypothetical protein ACF0H5_016805 [Mactra antiquata]
MSYVLAVIVVILSLVYAFYRFLNVTSGSDFADNSIDAFIIPDAGDSKLKKNVSNSETKYKADYTEEGRQILILYGTEYGCSEDIAKLLFDKIKTLNEHIELPPFQPRLINARDYKVIDFTREQVVFIVISTSGDGVPPTDSRPFFEFLHTNDIRINHVRYSVLALGDSNYPQYCKTGRMIDNRLQQLEGECIIPRHDVDMEDWSVINAWIHSIMIYLPSATLQTALDYIHHHDIIEETYSRTKPFMATLKDKYLLTIMETDVDKETIHCEFDISDSDLTWMSGDALGIYPHNNPDDVKLLLESMKCSGTETTNKLGWAYQLSEDKQHDDVYTLYDVLLKWYDLKVVKYELMELIASNITGRNELEYVYKLIKHGDSKSNCVLQTYIKKHEIVDVLNDFKSHTLPWQQILSCMRYLQPRYYSISSSPRKDNSTASVTAAVLRYVINDRQGTGVTTTYLYDRLCIGDKCPVFMSRNPDFRLPIDHTLPIILIGPGTGIAPFMAFIQEREMMKSSGPIWLYFGCRHKEKDYIYRKQLEQWSNNNVIRLSVAFSRDQEKKQYVQDKLYEDRIDIWKLIDNGNASVFVCGDAKHMAREVHTTLTYIVSDEGHMNEDAAVEYLNQMEKSARYQKDVWVV